MNFALAAWPALLIEQLNGPEMVARAVERSFNRRGVRNICYEWPGVPGAAQSLRNSLQTVAVASQQGDAHAVGNQGGGDNSADSAAGTGDNSVQPGKLRWPAADTRSRRR